MIATLKFVGFQECRGKSSQDIRGGEVASHLWVNRRKSRLPSR